MIWDAFASMGVSRFEASQAGKLRAGSSSCIDCCGHASRRRHSLAALRACFPGGSISGAPKDAAGLLLNWSPILAVSIRARSMLAITEKANSPLRFEPQFLKMAELHFTSELGLLPTQLLRRSGGNTRQGGGIDPRCWFAAARCSCFRFPSSLTFFSEEWELLLAGVERPRARAKAFASPRR